MSNRFLSFVCYVLFSCSTVAANATDGTIVVLGDSLSSGYGLGSAPSWVSLLADRLTAQGYEYNVVNASIAGDTTAGGLARLPRLLSSAAPRILILELGGNDGLRGLPVEQMRRNLAAIIESVRSAGADVVLTGIQIPPNYGPAYTGAFASVYPELAAEYDLHLVEFLMDGVALNDAMMQSDRTHPNAAGQPVMMENVWRVLNPLIE